MTDVLTGVFEKRSVSWMFVFYKSLGMFYRKKFKTKGNILKTSVFFLHEA